MADVFTFTRKAQGQQMIILFLQLAIVFVINYTCAVTCQNVCHEIGLINNI